MIERRADPAAGAARYVLSRTAADRPLRAEEIAAPYRRGMLLTARAASRAERTWLRETLGEEPPAFDTA